MPELIDKHAAYIRLKTEAQTHECYESKEAYNRAARIIDQMPTIPDIDRAAILRLCNEIQDIECDISNQTMNDVVYAKARMVFDKVKAIGKELTRDETERTDLRFFIRNALQTDRRENRKAYRGQLYQQRRLY